MQREIITIDEDKCTGCGLCVPNCPEGAIQVIDGKARLVGDLLCDGLGACLGHCPEGAIAIEKREAEPYDERRVMANIVAQGPNTIAAHLAHLREHNEEAYLKEALEFLSEQGIEPPAAPEPPAEEENQSEQAGLRPACPGLAARSFAPRRTRGAGQGSVSGESRLSHWPVQLHLISPAAPQYRGADLLLAADCTAYALGSFHEHLEGKALAIACPKLDKGQDIYLDKLRLLIDEARINTLTVMIMQVPCCSGLLALAREAAAAAGRKVPIKCVTVGIEGDILDEAWV